MNLRPLVCDAMVSLRCTIFELGMTESGHNRLLPHRSIGSRFASVNGHAIVRFNGVVLQAPSCIIDGGAIA
jgi:hypothetical protein